MKTPRRSNRIGIREPSEPWAVHMLEGALVHAHGASAEDDMVTLAPLPGALNGLASFDSDVAQSGACCPSGSCCASGSCCQSYSACVTVDEDEARRGTRDFRGDAGGAAGREKRLWPIPV